MIDQSRVADGFLFATHGDRCSYLGTSSCYKPRWLKQNAGRFVRIEDIQREAASLAAPDESEVNVVAASSGPNQMSSHGVRKDGGEESNVALVDNPAGDSSPPYQPTSLPVPIPEIIKGTTKAELQPPAKAATSENKGPKTETAPLEATGRKPGLSGSRRTSKARRKLSPERMRIVLDSLSEYPVLSHAARKAGIYRKTLEYWIKRSKAGDDGYDLIWQDELWRFHEHCAAAIGHAHDELLLRCHTIAMGVKYPGSEVYVTPPNTKMLRFLLELLLPEKYGKRRKVKATQRSHVLVVGQPTKKREYNTAASAQARQWKSLSRKIQNATG